MASKSQQKSPDRPLMLRRSFLFPDAFQTRRRINAGCFPYFRNFTNDVNKAPSFHSTQMAHSFHSVCPCRNCERRIGAPMNFAQAISLLQGRCYESRKVGNYMYLRRRKNGIGIQIDSSDKVLFTPDGRVILAFSDLVTRDRFNWFLPEPWLVCRWRNHMILYRAQDGYKNGWSVHGLIVINPGGTLKPRDRRKRGSLRPMSEVLEELRRIDRERQRLRQKMWYWRNKAKSKSPCRLTVTSILREKNAQLRSLKIQSFGIDRFFVEGGSETLDSCGEYALLRAQLDDRREMVCLKMVCPSTGAAYVSPVQPGIRTVDQALDWMYQVKNYRQNIAAER